MKTWQMIKELTENPKKVFMRKRDLLIVKIDKTTKTLSWKSGFEHLSADDEWVAIRQLETWQEALQAWANRESISLAVDGIEHVIDFNYLVLSREDIKKGEWYINE